MISDEDKFQDECGVFGVFNIADAAAHTVLGLHALQHRGQESCGIASVDQKIFHIEHAMGLVCDNLNNPQILNKLPGSSAIGHVRYSTTGDSNIRNVQPIYSEFKGGEIAVAHNGNLTNAKMIRKTLIQEGAIFNSTTDTEVINHLIARASEDDIVDKISSVLNQVIGAYSIVFLTQDKLIAVKDPNGVRPLMLGKLNNSYVVASESCAFDIIGADPIREFEAGEMIVIDKNGYHIHHPFKKTDPRLCIFEYVYFARPDSIIAGNYVYETRKNIGIELAREEPVSADIVVPVPDSGVPAAIGYAREVNLPFELGIIRNHYIGRTFIQPTDHIRNLGVKLKHNASKIVAGKDIILIDDSIVRGTTSKKIITMLKEAGAGKIHMRIASPPTMNPCFYGIDTPSRANLLAAQHSLEEMRMIIGVDSLAFISIDGLYRALTGADKNHDNPRFCDACFSGEYQIDIPDYS
jgi:amidophosphoribosyltransferase